VADKRVGNPVDVGSLGELALAVGPAGLYVPLHEITDEDEWIVDADISADFTSGVIDCRGKSRLHLGFVFSPTTDPVGDLYVQGSVGNVLFANLPLDEGKVFTSDPVAITHTSADLTKIVVNDPAALAIVEFTIINPMPYMRAFFDHGSGGSATGLDGYFVLD